MEQYAIIFCIGALVAADITVFGQFMLSQPIVSTAIAGMLLGNLETAIWIGAVMQLLWLKLVPAGGSIFLNGNLGSITAVSVYELTSHSTALPEQPLIFAAVLYGIASSYVFGYATTVQRAMNRQVVQCLHKALQDGKTGRFQYAHIVGILYTAAGGGAVVLGMSLLGTFILQSMPYGWYAHLEGYSQAGMAALFGIGFGTVLSMVWERRIWYYPALGIVLGIILLVLLP